MKINNVKMRDSDGLDRWRKQVERALESGGDKMEFYDIAERIDKGMYWLFDNDQAFVVVEPQQWPKHRAIHLLVAGGTLAGLNALIPTIERAGRLGGATKLTSITRKGFLKAFKHSGWKWTQIYVEKEL